MLPCSQRVLGTFLLAVRKSRCYTFSRKVSHREQTFIEFVKLIFIEFIVVHFLEITPPHTHTFFPKKVYFETIHRISKHSNI